MGVLGQIALGAMEGLIDGMSRAANDSRKPRPGFRCVYSLEGEIKWDSDYLRVFTEALRDFAEKNPNTTLARKLESDGKEVFHAGLVKSKDDHCSLWEVSYGIDDKEHVTNITFNTPNAVQKTRDGKRLKEVDLGFYFVDMEAEKEYRDKIAQTRKQIAAVPPLKSFLGVKFGDDPQKYRVDNEIINENADEGLILVRAQTNKFLNFDYAAVLVSCFTQKIVGVLSLVDRSEVEDVDDFMGRVRGLLQKKYGVEAIMCKENNDDADGDSDDARFPELDDDEDELDEDERPKKIILPFYDAEKWDPSNPFKGIKASITLNCDEDCVCMLAKDEIAYNEMMRMNEELKKDEAEKGREATIEKRRRADEDALNAL